MTDITQRIRESLRQRDGITEEAMRLLASEYSEEVSRINKRLANVGSLLDKGLKSEAIHQASIAPDVVDDASVFDFPEAEEWFDILQLLGVPAPPAVNRERANQINAAIVENQRLTGQLKNHRKMALARAPLAWRLKVLRQLVENDPLNLSWKDDLENWERGRLKEIRKEVREASKSADVSTIVELRREIDETAWTITPDKSLSAELENASARFESIKAQSEIKLIGPQVHEAFCQFEEDKVRVLLKRWAQNAEKLDRPAPREIAEQIEAAKAWIAQLDHDEEERRSWSRAIGKLEATIDRNASLSELETAYHGCTKFDEPIPLDLLRRYQSLAEERALTKRRAFQLGMGGIIAACVLLIAAFAWWQYKEMRSQKIELAVAEFETLLKEQNFDGAEQFHADLKAREKDIADHPSIASIALQLEKKVQEEKDRKSKFKEYLEIADQAEAGDIDRSALLRAETLAKTESEKAAAFKVQRRWSLWKAKVESSQTLKQLEKLKAHRGKLDELEQGIVAEETLLGIAIVASELEAILNEFPEASESSIKQVKAAHERATHLHSSLRSRMEQMQKMDVAWQKILSSPSLDSLAENLQRFSEAFPNSPIADELNFVAEESDLWTAALSWNEFIEATSLALRADLSEESMKVFRAAQDQMNDSVGESLDGLPKEIASCVSELDEHREILKRVFDGLPAIVFNDFYTVVESDGDRERYFVFKSYFDANRKTFASDASGSSVLRGIEVVVNQSGAVATRGLSGDLHVFPEPNQSITRLLDEYRRNKTEFLTDWSGQFLKLIANLQARDELDSQVKEILVSYLLSGACEGSDWLETQLAEQLQTLSERSSQTEDWFSPKKFESNLAGGLQDSLRQRLADVYGKRPQPLLEVKTLEKMKYTWVGVLGSNRYGEFEVSLLQDRLDTVNDEAGRLAVVRSSSDGRADWVVIGNLRSGEAELLEDTDDCVVGRPVFFFPSKNR